MLNLIFLLILVALGSNYHKIMGFNFLPLKSQKRGGGPDPTFDGFLHRFQLHCILYQSGRNKTGTLLGVFIFFYC